ncbi:MULTISPECIES: AraC family transcriptional regulator [Giesbergeria]|uniref:AraC family transcriptional regulator n=1 Tax=Giesbergeria sinuosa TaxID=80883 RepID=A0ABV9QFT0_9BURK
MISTMRVVRSASLNGYLEVAQSCGLDAAAMMRQVGLPTRCLENPETLVAAEAVRELLERSAQACGREDFALRMVVQRSFASLGPISLILKDEPTPRQALNTLCRYLRLLNALLITHIDETEDTVTIREEMLVQPTFLARQVMELAVGVMFRILQELLGDHWKPLQVCFAHRPPRDPSGHSAFFGPVVAFNQDYNGIVCRAQDLLLPLHRSDPGIARFARDYLERALHDRGHSARETVCHLIAALLPGGRCTAQQVAAHLHVDRRTIHRHLAKEGVCFSELLNEVRAELALRQIRENGLPLTEISGLLGFSSPSAFAHWFRTQFGCSVTVWRSRQEAVGAGGMAPPEDRG